MGKLTLTVAVHFAGKSKIAYAWKANHGKKDSAQARSERLDLTLPKNPKADEALLLARIEATRMALKRLDRSKITLRLNDQQLVDDINNENAVQIFRRVNKETHGKKMGSLLVQSYGELFKDVAKHSNVVAEFIDDKNKLFNGLQQCAERAAVGKRKKNAKHRPSLVRPPIGHCPDIAA